MAQEIKYKKPRLINVVSVSLAVAFALAAYLAYQYLPLFLQKQEAHRVLQETSSVFAGRSSYFVETPEAREKLRRKMEGDLRTAGVSDPNAEFWLEVEDNDVRFGVVYSVWLDWPFDVLKREEVVYEVEHVIRVRR